MVHSSQTTNQTRLASTGGCQTEFLHRSNRNDHHDEISSNLTYDLSTGRPSATWVVRETHRNKAHVQTDFGLEHHLKTPQGLQ
jgi:hypothetical protein